MKKLTLVFAALACLASPALAMNGTGTLNQPSRALLDLQASFQTLVDANATAPAAEKAAARLAYSTAEKAHANARAADQKGDTATFDKQASAFNAAYGQACAVLSGC